MGKSTISMAIFNSYVKLPEGNSLEGVPIMECLHGMSSKIATCQAKKFVTVGSLFTLILGLRCSDVPFG